MLWMRLTRFIARQVKVRPARVAGNRPVASITFDDFPKSAWETGGKILARFKTRGTYYTAGTFCGRTVDGVQFYDDGDLSALKAAGHEIACHGFGHQATPTLSDTELTADLKRNAAFLAPFLDGTRLESYAYPYGASSVRTKKFYAPHFSNLRGVHPGIIRGAVDLAQLNAVSLEMRSFSRERLDTAIAGAKAQNGWIAFYTHGVSDSPTEYDSTPTILTQALQAVTDAGIEIMPMRQAVGVALA
jgi:peptidoglycan/xylan/chitin deacetylase (PgdA/CDA1 family)